MQAAPSRATSSMNVDAAFRTAKHAVTSVSAVAGPHHSSGRTGLAAKDGADRGAFRPGSTPDIVARLVADGLQQKYPASAFVVENKPGASGNLGTDIVAKADARWFDHRGQHRRTARHQYPVVRAIALRSAQGHRDQLPNWSPSRACSRSIRRLGVNSVADLVALLRKNPGKYNFASIGNGSLSHLAMEAIAIKAGAQLVHVPYPSSPQAITAVIRNDAQIACLPAISVTPQAATGAVKILAVSTARRSPYLPDVPTLKESGHRCGSRCLERLDRTGRHAKADH